MTSRQKQPRKPTKKAGNKTSDKSSNASEPVESDSQEQKERLDRELVWCIEQLRLGITNKNSSATQTVEAVRVLRMLENPSTPAPKKRLLMKSTFGDYRKKMSDELRKIDEKAKIDRSKTHVKPAPLADQRKSTFYRRSNASESSSSSAVASSDASEAARFLCDPAVMCGPSGGGSFAFDFPASCPDTANERDMAATGATDSDTSSRTNKPTRSETGDTSDRVDGITAAGVDFKLTNTALCFGSSTEGTPFQFNFDLSSASSDASVAAGFLCDTAVMCGPSGGRSFAFNFPANCPDTANNRDKAAAGVLDSDTSGRTNKPTCSTTGDTTDGVDGITAACGDFKLTNTACCFSSSSEGTPFQFNFESS